MGIYYAWYMMCRICILAPECAYQDVHTPLQNVLRKVSDIRYMIVAPNLYNEILFDFSVKIAHIWNIAEMAWKKGTHTVEKAEQEGYKSVCKSINSY